MKRIALLTLLALAVTAPSLFAQDHGEVGAFAELFRLQATNPVINFVGVGGRVSVNVHHDVQLEAEMGYDFKRNFTSEFSNGINSQLVTTHLRNIHGLFGPKLQTGGGAFRAFVTVKGGFINFGASNENVPNGFISQIGDITSGHTDAVLYPGAGIEAYLGPIGLRLDAGDEIYFENGANHNLRVTFGPHIRF